MSGVVTQKDIEWHFYNKERRLLGTAAWMSDKQLSEFRIGHIWLGRTSDGTLAGVRDDRHVLLCSGSRGGKGASFIVPNLAFWPGSAVVIDPKGENAIVTARRRGSGSAWADGLGQKVHVLDPFNVVRTRIDDFADIKASFNPLDMISRDDPESIDTAFRIAEALLPGEKSNDPFFDDAAKEFLANIALHVASAPDFTAEERNLLTVRKLIAAGDQRAAAVQSVAIANGNEPNSYDALFSSMKRNTAFNGVVSRAGVNLLDLRETSPRLFGSIVQVARTNTRFIDGDGMRTVLKRSTFKLSDLKRSKKGETLYLCLPQRYMETCFYWFRMMVSLITSEMERAAYRPQTGHPVLMLLDEFAALKRMRTIENAAAQIAGFGVKLVFVVQTLGQLKEHYKDNWETFIANSGVKLFSCNDDNFTREYVSKLIGDEDVVLHTRTTSQTKGTSQSNTAGSSYSESSGSSWSFGNGQMSSSSNFGHSRSSNASATLGLSASETSGCSSTIHKRPLLTPDEVGRKFGDRQTPFTLVLLSGQQPATLRKTMYFRDSAMVGSYGWHPDHAKPIRLADLRAQRAAEEALAQERARQPPRDFTEEERVFYFGPRQAKPAPKKKLEITWEDVFLFTASVPALMFFASAFIWKFVLGH
jgi:type IV secretory pathway TraG/TraD family ATPase VirD4